MDHMHTFSFEFSYFDKKNQKHQETRPEIVKFFSDVERMIEVIAKCSCGQIIQSTFSHSEFVRKYW